MNDSSNRHRFRGGARLPALLLALCLGLPGPSYALRPTGLEEQTGDQDTPVGPKADLLAALRSSAVSVPAVASVRPPAAGAEEPQKVPFDLSQLAQWYAVDNHQWVVDTATLPEGLLRDFIAWLDELDLDEVVVIGGILRDSLLGGFPKDVDFAVRVVLPAPLQEQFEADVGQLTPMALGWKYKLSYRADQVLHRVAKRMAVSPKRLLRLEERFRGQGLEYSFSVVVGSHLIDVGSQSTFSFNQIAMDRHGRVYMPPHRMGLQHLRDGLVAIVPPSGAGPQPRVGLKTALQAVRFKHQHRFRMEADTQGMLIRAARERRVFVRPSRFRRIWWAVKGTLRELRQAVGDPSLAGAHLRAARRLAAGAVWFGWMDEYPVRWLSNVLDAVPDPEISLALAELDDLGVLDRLRQLGVDVEAVVRERLQAQGPDLSAGAEEPAGLAKELQEFSGRVLAAPAQEEGATALLDLTAFPAGGLLLPYVPANAIAIVRSRDDLLVGLQAAPGRPIPMGEILKQTVFAEDFGGDAALAVRETTRRLQDQGREVRPVSDLNRILAILWLGDQARTDFKALFQRSQENWAALSEYL